MGVLGRYFEKVSEDDESRHAAGIQAWSESVGGSVRIADAPRRALVKVAGVVQRMTVYPQAGKETLEVEIYDGTGELTAVLMGRRKMGGVTLAAKVVVEGVIGEQHGELRMINPRLEVRV